MHLAIVNPTKYSKEKDKRYSWGRVPKYRAKTHNRKLGETEKLEN